jgi:hypothetical protein
MSTLSKIQAAVDKLSRPEQEILLEQTADIGAADIVIQPETADMEREFGTVLEACFSQKPPTFIRTNDALHFASAKVAGELEIITANMRQRC